MVNCKFYFLLILKTDQGIATNATSGTGSTTTETGTKEETTVGLQDVAKLHRTRLATDGTRRFILYRTTEHLPKLAAAGSKDEEVESIFVPMYAELGIKHKLLVKKKGVGF